MPPWIDIRAPQVNPLGNTLSQYSSATWINLGQPGVLVDYTSLGTGTPLAAGTLPGGGTYTQAAGSGQSEETVQTSASTVARWAFVANLPRIGLLADGGIGLVLEPPRTNTITRSDALNHAYWSADVGVTVTAAYVTSPAASFSAMRVQTPSAAFGISNSGAATGPNEVHSAWARSAIGAGAQISKAVVGNTPLVGVQINTTETWSKWQSYPGNSVASAFHTMADGRVVAGGPAAGARDEVAWGVQVEVGKYATNLLPTAGANASRAGYRVSIPISRYVRGGVFRAVLTTVPHGAATEYDGDSATIRLWTIDANTYAEVNTTTRVLTVSVNGVARVAGVPLWWLRGHRVQWSWEVGGGNLRVRYRYSTDQGATWTLPFDPFGGVVNVDSAISTASSTIDLYSDSGSSKWWGTGVVSEEAILTAPAWALQALPTDVASVKAFFRLDNRYTLSASTVSILDGHTAAAVTSFTQGTGANQPVFNASGFGPARPSADFDGSSDYLEAGALSEWITASTGAVYVLFRQDAVSTNNAPNYNNYPLWENIGAYAGIATRNGPTAGGFNYDGTYDDVNATFALATAQVARWRHASGNVYMRVGSSGESAPTASGNTALLTGNNRIGGNPGAVGLYFAGRIGVVVAMNTDPTAQEDAAIMSFLNAYGGLP